MPYKGQVRKFLSENQSLEHSKIVDPKNSPMLEFERGKDWSQKRQAIARREKGPRLSQAWQEHYCNGIS